MNTRKSLETLYERDMLNSKGLKQYIKYLKEEVKDHSERIKEVIKDKGKHRKLPKRGTK